MLHKIPLTPFPTELDVWVVDNGFIDSFCQEYGEEFREQTLESLTNFSAFTSAITTSPDSKAKGRFRLFCVFDAYDLGIITHESLHVLYNLHQYYDAELESEEWNCYMLQYIVNQILKLTVGDVVGQSGQFYMP